MTINSRSFHGQKSAILLIAKAVVELRTDRPCITCAWHCQSNKFTVHGIVSQTSSLCMALSIKQVHYAWHCQSNKFTVHVTVSQTSWLCMALSVKQVHCAWHRQSNKFTVHGIVSQTSSLCMAPSVKQVHCAWHCQSNKFTLNGTVSQTSSLCMALSVKQVHCAQNTTGDHTQWLICYRKSRKWYACIHLQSMCINISKKSIPKYVDFFLIFFLVYISSRSKP